MEILSFNILLAEMGSNPLKLHTQTAQTLNPKSQSQLTKPLSSSSSSFISVTLPKRETKSQAFIKISCSLSSSSSTPPASKEAAILQAKTCLSTTLEKPLNTTAKLTTTKLKRTKQPRFRLEIPVIDDSPESLSQLAFELFKGLPIKRKGCPVKILIIWPDVSYKEAALNAFTSSPDCQVLHANMSSLSDGDNTRILSSAEVAVFMAVQASQLAAMKSISDGLYPRPVVIFNPRWAFEDESEFGEMSAFVGSFEVIYSFMGLEVRGLLSKRKGVIFKCVRDGVVSGERWSVLVEEEDGKLKVISTFKSRPSIGEVENVLYNLMAMNSPVTKSVKFFKGLVSNVTGKKEQ